MDNQTPPAQPMAQPTTAPVSPPTKQPRSLGWLKWVLVGLFVAILSSGATYFVMNQSQQNQPLPTPSPTEAQATEHDTTANWKTYIDSAGKFYIKYPDTWSLLPSTIEKLSNESLSSWLTMKDREENQSPQCPNCLKVFSQKEVKGEIVIVIDGKRE